MLVRKPGNPRILLNMLNKCTLLVEQVSRFTWWVFITRFLLWPGWKPPCPSAGSQLAGGNLSRSVLSFAKWKIVLPTSISSFGIGSMCHGVSHHAADMKPLPISPPPHRVQLDLLPFNVLVKPGHGLSSKSLLSWTIVSCSSAIPSRNYRLLSIAMPCAQSGPLITIVKASNELAIWALKLFQAHTVPNMSWWVK